MRLRYRIPLAVIAFMMVCTMFLGSSYAFWKATAYQETVNKIEAGCFEITFTEQSSSINLTNTYPMYDEKGLKTTPYTFTLTNTCSLDAKYVVYLNTLETTKTKIPDNLIKYSLNNSDAATLVAKNLAAADKNSDTNSFKYDKTLLQSYALEEGALREGESVQYDLRLWIDSSATTEINGYAFEAGIATIAYATDLKE